MSLACKLTKTEEAILIHLCEEKIASALENKELDEVQKEEQYQVFQVYNKLILGLDYTVEQPSSNPMNTKIKELVLATVNRVQEIDVAGSIDVMVDSFESLFLTIFPAHKELDFEEESTWVYLISFDVVNGKLLIEAQEEEIEEVDYYRFLSNQLEQELIDELSKD